MCIHVFFDESGHTGSNFLDPEQSLLLYGSLRTTDADASRIKRTYFKDVQAKELHHVQLRKYPRSQRSIVEFLQRESDWSRQNFKWFLIEKPYALLGKYVDILIETAVHRLDDNLYSAFGNQKLVMLLWRHAQSFERPDLMEALAEFLSFGRNPSLESLATLERKIATTSVGDDKLDRMLRLPFEILGADILNHMDTTCLDLSFTGAWTLANLWYQEIGEPYRFIHDASAPLIRQQTYWCNMTREERGYVTEKIGPYEFPTNTPLIETRFEDSEKSDALQLVDVLLGSRRFWLESRRISKRQNDPYFNDLDRLFSHEEPTWHIAPSPDVLNLVDVPQSKVDLDRAFARLADSIFGR